MLGLFGADLTILFEHPSLWRSLIEALVAALPFAVGISGFISWRCGDKWGLSLIAWVTLYLIWVLQPIALPLQADVVVRVLSVLGWFWLIGAWARRAMWHEPRLLVVNGGIVGLMIALFLVMAIALLRDALGLDSSQG